MKYYIAALKQYAVFSGRASRKAYWMFFLFNIVIALVIGLVEELLGLAPANEGGPLTGLYQIAVLIPSIAIGVRRMHDVGRRGWWLLLPIVNFVFLVTSGDVEENRYGPIPKEELAQ